MKTSKTTNQNEDVPMYRRVETEEIRHKGIWKRFFHMCRVAPPPYFLILYYVILSAVIGRIAVKIPQVNANFFAGDASVQSVSMFLGAELLTTVMYQYLLYVGLILRSKTNRNLRNALWGKILRLQPSYFDKTSANTLLSRITVDSESMNAFVMDIVLNVLNQIYMLVLTIYEMNRISVEAGLWLLLFAPLTFVLTFILGRINLKFQKTLQFHMSDLTGYLSELVGSMSLIKSFGRQEEEAKRGRAFIDSYYKANAKVVWFDIFRSILGSLVEAGPEICMILMGMKMLREQQVDAAGWYTFYLYAGTFIVFCNSLGSVWESAKATQGTLYKVSDVLYEEEEALTPYIEDVVASGDISFDKVTFGYEEEPVIKEASFTIPGHKTTALIGYSGAGKSTILKLLERLYPIEDGRILAGGQEIDRYPLPEWRMHLALVSQHTPILSGTIRENILYGVTKAVSEEEIRRALKLSFLEEFVESLPKGLDHEVGQFGGTLSGGQRQKIALTRAILTGAEVILLDEPTASLDIISAGEVMKMIDELEKNHTILVVTHDRMLVSRADHVLVLDPDKKVTEGSWEQLKTQHPFAMQMEGEGVPFYE